MCWILIFPEHLLSTIAVEWIELQDVSRLDSAVPSGRTRQEMKQVLYQHTRPYSTSVLVFGLYRNFYEGHYIQLCAWVVAKGISVDTLALTRDVFQSGLWNKLLNKAASGVVTLVCAAEQIGGVFWSEWKQALTSTLCHCCSVTDIVCSGDFSSDDYKRIADLLPNLKSIKLSKEFKEDAIEYLAQKLTKLTALEMGRFIPDGRPRELLFSLLGPQLLHLRGPPGTVVLVEETCELILQHCPNLLFLKLTIEDPSLRVLARLPQQCPKLTELRLSTYFLCEPSLKYVAMLGYLLTKLTVSYSDVSDTDMANLVQHCPRLHELFIESYKEVGDMTAAAVAKHCPALRELHMYSASVTDAAMYSLGSGPLTLHRLSIYSASVSDDALLYVLVRSPQLQYLDITGVLNVSDAPIMQLPRLCPRLRELYVGSNISMGSLAMVIRKCKDIRCASADFARQREIEQMWRREAGKHKVVLDTRY